MEITPEEKKRQLMDKRNEYRRMKKLENPDYDKPKDPDYFKTYFQEKLKFAKWYCDICEKDVPKDSKCKHIISNKHLLNEVKQKMGENTDNNDFNKFYLEKIQSTKKHCEICDCYIASSRIKSHLKTEKHILKEKLNKFEQT
jgi:ribosomal protein S26